jgi:uncharacterized protein
MANNFKKIMLKKLTLFFFLLLGTVWAFAQEVPDKDLPSKPTNTLVNDYTNSLSPNDKMQLEQKLDNYNDSTSTGISIVLIHSLGDYDIDSYGTALGRKWGLGQKGKNNGILILAAMDDHKVAIQVGYGLEGSVPDAIAKQIVDQDITPHFKQGDYYGGLDLATTDLIKAARGQFKGTPHQHHGNGGGFGAGIIILIIIVIILIIIFRNGGGGGQIIGRRGGASPFWWFIAGDMLGSGGRGWGGFSGGNDGGGGWSGPDGGGGFGGGSFGGGGASGGW